jgi:hypothetical protein
MATDGVTGTVTSCAVDASGNAFFCVDASGVWGPDGNLVSQGYIEPGWIRYGLIENKIIVDIDIRHDPLTGSVGLQIVPFGAEPILLATSNTQGSLGPLSPFTADLTVGEMFCPIITLMRSGTDSTKGPTLRRWTLGAFPVVSRQDQIVVPIMIGKEVKTPVREGGIIGYEPLEVFQSLKTLESTSQVVTYEEGNASYTCVIDQIEVKAEKWADDFSFFEGLLMVKLITLDVI